MFLCTKYLMLEWFLRASNENISKCQLIPDFRWNSSTWCSNFHSKDKCGQIKQFKRHIPTTVHSSIWLVGDVTRTFFFSKIQIMQNHLTWTLPDFCWKTCHFLRKMNFRQSKPYQRHLPTKITWKLVNFWVMSVEHS